MRKFLTTAFLLFVTFSMTANAQNINEIPTVSVTGSAEIFVVPDEAVFSLKVEKTNMELDMAKAENDKAVSAIIELAKRHGIDGKDIKTDYISVNKAFEYVGTGVARKRVFTGFRVSKTVIVKLRKLEKFEELFSDSLKTGLTEVSNVSFQTSESRKHMDEARIKAITAAREKASALAKALNQSIGKAVMIKEASYNFRSSMANNLSLGSESSGESTSTFAAGTIKLRAQIEVKFLLN
jgi:uncharacterized protein YggE